MSRVHLTAFWSKVCSFSSLSWRYRNRWSIFPTVLTFYSSHYHTAWFCSQVDRSARNRIWDGSRRTTLFVAVHRLWVFPTIPEIKRQNLWMAGVNGMTSRETLGITPQISFVWIRFQNNTIGEWSRELSLLVAILTVNVFLSRQHGIERGWFRALGLTSSSGALRTRSSLDKLWYDMISYSVERDSNIYVYTKRRLAMVLRRLNKTKEAVKLFREVLSQWWIKSKADRETWLSSPVLTLWLPSSVVVMSLV